MNIMILVGNLGSDPETRTTTSGKTVTSFSLATSSYSGGEEKTEWTKVVCWEKAAEFVGKYCKKGDKVAVNGRKETRKWTDNDGNQRESVECIANNVEKHSPKPAEDRRTTSGRGDGTPPDENF